MKSLVEVASDAAQRPRLVSAIADLIDREVSSRGGLKGMALKTGYSVVKKLKGGRMIPDVVDGLLDEFVAGLEPVHATYRDSGGAGGFGPYLRSNEKRAIDALLAVTDARAKRTSHGVLRSTYEKLRPMAEREVAESLPGVGRLVDQFCA
jgi:hypothetical protein